MFKSFANFLSVTFLWDTLYKLKSHFQNIITIAVDVEQHPAINHIREMIDGPSTSPTSVHPSLSGVMGNWEKWRGYNSLDKNFHNHVFLYLLFWTQIYLLFSPFFFDFQIYFKSEPWPMCVFYKIFCETWNTDQGDTLLCFLASLQRWIQEPCQNWLLLSCCWSFSVVKTVWICDTTAVGSPTQFRFTAIWI